MRSGDNETSKSRNSYKIKEGWRDKARSFVFMKEDLRARKIVLFVFLMGTII